MAVGASRAAGHEPVQAALLLLGQRVLVTGEPVIDRRLVRDELSFVHLDRKSPEEGEVTLHHAEAVEGASTVPPLVHERVLDHVRVGEAARQTARRRGGQVAEVHVLGVDLLKLQGSRGEELAPDDGQGADRTALGVVVLPGHLDVRGERADRLTGERRLVEADPHLFDAAVRHRLEDAGVRVLVAPGVDAVEAVVRAAVPELTHEEDRVDHRGGVAVRRAVDVASVDAEHRVVDDPTGFHAFTRGHSFEDPRRHARGAVGVVHAAKHGRLGVVRVAETMEGEVGGLQRRVGAAASGLEDVEGLVVAVVHLVPGTGVHAAVVVARGAGRLAVGARLDVPEEGFSERDRRVRVLDVVADVGGHGHVDVGQGHDTRVVGVLADSGVVIAAAGLVGARAVQASSRAARTGGLAAARRVCTRCDPALTRGDRTWADDLAASGRAGARDGPARAIATLLTSRVAQRKQSNGQEAR